MSQNLGRSPLSFGQSIYKSWLKIVWTNCLFTNGYKDFFFERDFMLSLSDNNQADVVEAFISTSRYLDDLLNIDSPYFAQM